MNNPSTKNTIYVGLLAGLVISVICLLMPLAKGSIVWYQLTTVLVTGLVIGYLFRNKVKHSYAVAIYGVIYPLALTRYSLFIDEKPTFLFTIALTLATIFFFLLARKFFDLKMNKILQHAIAIFGFLILFFVIPVILLIIDRASYTP